MTAYHPEYNHDERRDECSESSLGYDGDDGADETGAYVHEAKKHVGKGSVDHLAVLGAAGDDAGDWRSV